MLVGPKFMTKGSLSWYRNVSKAIRKKGFDAHAKLNGLAMVCMSKWNNKAYG